MTREEMISLLTEWELYKKAHCTESDGIDIDKLNMYQFATIKSRLPPAEGAVPDNAAEQNKRMREWFKERTGLDDTLLSIHMEQIDVMLKGVQQQPTAEGAEEILERAFNNGAIRRITYIPDIRGIISAMNDFATLHAQRLAEKMVEEDDLQKLMNDISEWSDKTFGNGQRNPAIIYHLKKEVDELIAAIEKTNTLGSDPSVGVGEFGRQRTVTRVEYADCLMLLLDSAHHFGISAKELLSVTRGKLEINKVRKWGSPDENGVVEHIE